MIALYLCLGALLSVPIWASGTEALVAPVYLIRHGEKPSSGNGLSTEGKERADCLVNVFGSSSSFKIGKIIAQANGTKGMTGPFLTY